MAKQPLDQKVTIQISAAQKIRIIKAAKKQGISAAEYIRRAVSKA